MDAFPRALLVAAVTGGVASALLHLAYTTVPVLGVVSGIMAPLPLCYWYLRRSRLAGIAACLVALTLVMFLEGIPSSVVFLVQSGSIALLLGEGLLRGYGGVRSLALAVSGSLLCALLVAAVWFGMQGGSLHSQILAGIDTSISQSLALYQKADIPADVMEEMKRGMEAVGRFMKDAYPALVLVGLGLVAGLNLLLLRRLLPADLEKVGLGSFTAFRTPDALVWLLIIAGFSRFAPPPLGGNWSLNLLILLGALYFIQGLAVLLLLSARLPAAGILRVMLAMMLLFQPYLVLVVAGVGLFDLWGDFRTPRQRQNL